jgi:hypothetical protein
VLQPAASEMKDESHLAAAFAGMMCVRHKITQWPGLINRRLLIGLEEKVKSKRPRDWRIKNLST